MWHHTGGEDGDGSESSGEGAAVGVPEPVGDPGRGAYRYVLLHALRWVVCAEQPGRMPI